MANQDAAFGLRPIGKVGSNRNSGGLSEYEIAACASAIYQNDVVKASGAGIANPFKVYSLLTQRRRNLLLQIT